MRSILLVIAAALATTVAWGIYGPVIHWGQHGMATEVGGIARMRPFVCVGLAYFVIAVIVPGMLLKVKGEAGEWTSRGLVYSLAGGALGALGALGLIMAFNFGGRPVYVMPLVFGGSPVVNSFLTIYMAKRMKDISPLFLAGLLLVVLGAVTVMLNSPKPVKVAHTETVAAEVAEATATDAEKSADSTSEKTTDDATKTVAASKEENESHNFRDLILRILSIATVIVCWGGYGPIIHKGQAAMSNSKLRPMICVGMAYFAIAVIVPNLWLLKFPELSTFSNFSGTGWSLAAGSCGAVGALGIIMAFTFGGKPVYVMPLVFAGAPVINTLFTTWSNNLWDQVGALFLAGIIIVIAGAAIVLIFAPRNPIPAKAAVTKVKEEKKAGNEKSSDK